MIRIVTFLLAAALAVGAAAQQPLRPPVTGPSPEPARRDLWQLLTPEQREHLWRVLTPEQRVDVWRGLEAQEQREFRERLGPPDVDGGGRSWALRRAPEAGNGQPRAMMTPEERQRMREQIREAQRLRRERLEAESRPPGQ